MDRAQVFEALVDAAGDPDAGVRLSALRGLAAIGLKVTDDPPAALVSALDDVSDENRAAAAYAILQFRQKPPG